MPGSTVRVMPTSSTRHSPSTLYIEENFTHVLRDKLRNGELDAIIIALPVIYHSNSPKPAVEARFNARYRSLNELLQEADFVCLTLPLTAQTEGLIGAEQFALMRPESIFINISRGKVVDEAALIVALQQGQIRAAGLDVFVREPLEVDSPLLQLDNVVATPHIGSATVETREAMARCAVDNLLTALAGERPANRVN